MKKRPAVLITGGARRVGAALSLYFARQGYDIALHYNTSKKDALRIQKHIQKLGAACELFQCDLTDITAFPALMKHVKKSLPRCAALINNASVFERAEFMETDEALFDRQFVVNFKAPFFLTHAFAKTFGKGCVVNILDTDITGNHGSHFAYLLSKKALADFTAMAARALGPDIRVNGVCPGCMIPVDKNDTSYEDKMAEKIPLRRHPSLEELADGVRTLMEAPYLTGQLLFIDGGMHVL